METKQVKNSTSLQLNLYVVLQPATRSSRSQMFFKKAVFKNFAIFTGKHMCWILFVTKFLAFRAATLLKRDSNTDVFLWILRNF